MDNTIEIYTDGSCLGNPGTGGWAAILTYQDHKKEIVGGDLNTTNNQMELMAAIQALRAIKPQRADVRITTDSQYLRDGITKWINNWRENGWRTANKKPVKNEHLWKELDMLNNRHNISWEWTKGHAGHPLNEQCDKLARAEAETIHNQYRS